MNVPAGGNIQIRRSSRITADIGNSVQRHAVLRCPLKRRLDAGILAGSEIMQHAIAAAVPASAVTAAAQQQVSTLPAKGHAFIVLIYIHTLHPAIAIESQHIGAVLIQQSMPCLESIYAQSIPAIPPPMINTSVLRSSSSGIKRGTVLSFCQMGFLFISCLRIHIEILSKRKAIYTGADMRKTIPCRKIDCVHKS